VDNAEIVNKIMMELAEEDTCVDDSRFFPLTPRKCRASFIDGSNYEILSAPSKDFYLIRIATERFDGDKRQSETLQDLLAMTSDNETRIISAEREEHLVSSSMDMTRNILEWRAAEGEDNALVFIDGGLESPFFETPVLDSVCGVIKGSRISTGSIAKRAIEKGLGAWAYTLKENDYLCRFNRFSRLVLEAETRDPENLNCASYFSSDPFLPGYPFGLAEAHRRAKIGASEVRELRALLYARGSGYVELHDFLEA
jgi:hypothetical protein